MSERAFVDTNILIYSVADDALRSEAAKNLLRSDLEFHITFQVIGEFISACQRKKIITQTEIVKFVQEYLRDFPIQFISDSTILSAIELQTHYRLSYWDALIVASALESNCSLLITEDMQDGLVIKETLTIKNPFATPSLQS
jgi:predicted nucleic acid-binding protein